MNDFRKLDPQMRSLALVGNFLQHWAVMESKLNDVLGKCLGLDSVSTVIVSKNIQLRDKTKIIKTSIDMAFLIEAERNEFKKLIQSISEISPKRNMIAHDFFSANEDGECVDFHVVKADGKLNFPKISWSVDDFNEQNKLMNTYYDGLVKLLNQLSRANVAKALLRAQANEPTLLLGQLGFESLPDLHIPGLRGSSPPPATPQTSDETPPKRRRKAAPRKRS